MTHAAESTHYYTRKGEPAYTVTAKAGHQRPTNVADARKLGLVPSVTTILQCACRPALERWKAEQLMMAALTLPRVDGETEKEWIARVWNDSKEQSRKAAERGVAIHAAIQGHYQDEALAGELGPHVLGAVECVEGWCGSGWTAERSFAHPLGFGGKVDLSCKQAVLDFKTKEFDTIADLKTWDEHHMQLAAYRHGLGMEKARCAIVYVSTTTPGLAKLIEIPEDDLQRGWTCFYSLLHFWQARSTYKSSFEKLAA